MRLCLIVLFCVSVAAELTASLWLSWTVLEVSGQKESSQQLNIYAALANPEWEGPRWWLGVCINTLRLRAARRFSLRRRSQPRGAVSHLGHSVMCLWVVKAADGLTGALLCWELLMLREGLSSENLVWYHGVKVCGGYWKEATNFPRTLVSTDRWERS